MHKRQQCDTRGKRLIGRIQGKTDNQRRRRERRDRLINLIKLGIMLDLSNESPSI